jgi:hypothetical protein
MIRVLLATLLIVGLGAGTLRAQSRQGAVPPVSRKFTFPVVKDGLITEIDVGPRAAGGPASGNTRLPEHTDFTYRDGSAGSEDELAEQARRRPVSSPTRN